MRHSSFDLAQPYQRRRWSAKISGLCVAVCVGVFAADRVGAARPTGQHAGDIPVDSGASEAAPGRRDEVVQFGRRLARRNGLDEAWVLAVLEQARLQPRAIKLVLPAPTGTAKNWAAYRQRFIEPRRIGAGFAFWIAHEARLRQAEEAYGVAPEVIVGIIGVETLFGRYTGNFRVIDVLVTLGFDFPSGYKDRSPFFRKELERFFVLCHAQSRDPLEVEGSYAGALGMPQFMPSSFNKYAIDFDRDGQIDLRHSVADVIGSVARAMYKFGWQHGVPARFDVAAPSGSTERAILLAPDILPTFSAKEFTAHGARLAPAAASYGGKLALVELQNGAAAASYVAGTENFYAITRYNRSSYYAMAVIELAEAIGEQRSSLMRQQAIGLGQ